VNKQRRKMIEDLQAKIEELKSQLESIDVSEVRDEEQDYFDNMAEAFQGGEKGQAAEAAIDALDQAVESIQEAVDALESAINSLDTAKE
jgi:prefoldin subunit 5